MFQSQERQMSPIETSLSIQEVQYRQKNYQLIKFDHQKSNDNHSTELDPRRQWTPTEENLMFELHNQHGNKWAIIAQHLHGRSDNSVKNHFYSRLRKGLRKLNKIINTQHKKSFKQFKIIDLYKVIEASDQKFKEIKTQQYEFADVGLDLKNRIFLFAQEIYHSDESKLKTKQLITDLNSFTKEYKRKSKKNRRYSPMGTESVYRAHIKGQLHQTEFLDNRKDSEEGIDEESEDDGKQLLDQVLKASQVMNFKSNDQKNENCDKNDKIETKKQSPKQHRKIFSKSEDLLCTTRTRKKRPTYTHFSDQEQENEEEANREQKVEAQRLDTFASNLLRTFQSFISFESFNCNGLGEELLFP